jgi:Calcineurin-like phosphoesterase
MEPQGGLEAAAAESDAELRAHLSDALAALEAVQGPEGILVSPQHQLGSLLQTYLVEHPPDLGLVETPAPGETFEVKFDEGDIAGWARGVLEWWRRIRPEPWVDPPEKPEPVGDGERLRIAILGDWGTGLYGAPVSAKTIAAEGGYDLLVHLGDVYYAGTPKEEHENFMAFWPDVDGALSRTCNSNHEMYSGGEGLYKVTMPAFGQAATCWAVQNDHWLLIGLDSAYSEHDLTHDQQSWVQRLLSAASDRRVILFCHHQPFSLLDHQGPKLTSKLGRILDSGRITAWYWGHEHRCVIHDLHPQWKLHGRCVGHGGFPAFRDNLHAYPEDGEGWRRLPTKNLVPGGVVLDMPNPYVEGHAEQYGAHGFIALELDGISATETVRAPAGDVLRTQAM